MGTAPEFIEHLGLRLGAGRQMGGIAGVSGEPQAGLKLEGGGRQLGTRNERPFADLNSFSVCFKALEFVEHQVSFPVAVFGKQTSHPRSTRHSYWRPRRETRGQEFDSCQQ